MGRRPSTRAIPSHELHARYAEACDRGDHRLARAIAREEQRRGLIGPGHPRLRRRAA